jgi:hypothetical protein
MGQRRYWVVSPNVDDHEKTVNDWKRLILEGWAIMGWLGNERKYPGGKKMGLQFAGKGNPPVQIGDAILIARSRTNKDVVAAGIVDSESTLKEYPKELKRNGKPVQVRKLTSFKDLREEKLPGEVLQALGNKALPWKRTMRELQDYDEDVTVKKWLGQLLQLSDQDEEELEVSEPGGWGGEETPEHKRLKKWCARHPEDLGLSNVLSVPGEIDCSPCDNQTADLADVIFQMRGGRYAVIEVETSNAKPGAYQALKYKTLLCAHKGYPVTDSRVKAKLVAWEIPDEVRYFCNKYGIDCHKKRLKLKTI